MDGQAIGGPELEPVTRFEPLMAPGLKLLVNKRLMVNTIDPVSTKHETQTPPMFSQFVQLLQLEDFPHLTQLRGLSGTNAYLATALDHTLRTEDRRDRMATTPKTSR